MSVTVLCGNAIERLRALPEGSVHCCITSPPYFGLRAYLPDDHPDKHLEIGGEATPAEWVAKLVAVFREVRRVLRPDGVCFVNVGDSYAGPKGNTAMTGGKSDPERDRAMFGDIGRNQKVPDGLKQKDLVGQPWLLAFALRADGWWLRAEIIWSKPNPMPESVTDRPTKAHEQVFLLTKGPRYFWDQEAVKEQNTASYRPSGQQRKSNGFLEAHGDVHRGLGEYDASAGRNLRSVWQIATEPFPEAHFATFPTELARRCILAGTSAKGCCPECLAPWARVVERASEQRQEHWSGSGRANGCMAGGGHAGGTGHWVGNSETLGWRPTCACGGSFGHHTPIPATILDCFAGSGTTGVVADELGRDAILIELSPTFADMCERRVARARSRRMLGDAPRFEPLPGQTSLFDDEAAA